MRYIKKNILSCILLCITLFTITTIIFCTKKNHSDTHKKIIETFKKQGLTQALQLFKKTDLLNMISTKTASIFAPLDSAFNALTKKQKQLIDKDPTKIGSIHIIEKKLDKQAIANLADTHQTVNTRNSNFPLLFTHQGPATLLVWPVKKADETPEHMATIQGCIPIENGFIHIIDSVLIPDTKE